MRLYLLLGFITSLFFISCENSEQSSNINDNHDFLRDFPALSDNGLANAVIEIPAGSNQKWEVEKENGHLEWEIVDDTLRVVPYLPYPANYGMIPQTWLPAEEGGDDDPLDMIVLGPSVDRGTILEARVVGVIKLLDHGEQDDKLIAVDPNSWFGSIHTLEQLETDFPGIVSILTEWFGSYKSGNLVVVQGVEDEEVATDILLRSIEAYQRLYGD